MLAFGTGIGLLFPPFAAFALNDSGALSARFFLMCVAAGLTVGVVNYLLFRFFVCREMRRVVEGMRHINDAVATAEGGGDSCRDGCKLDVVSADLIGEMAGSFNNMTDAIARRISVESTTRAMLAELSQTMDLDEISGTILKGLSNVCGARAGVLYADTGSRMEYMQSFGIDVTEELPRVIDATQGLAARVLETGEPMHISPEDDGFSWFRGSTPLGSLRPMAIGLVPLMAEERPVGLVALACSQSRLDDEMQALREAIRTQSAPYLATAVMHRKVEDLAAIDELTRLLNRRFGMRRLDEEFSRSMRHGVPVSVLMLDIDDFKILNDTFGHDAGDSVLRSVARLLESTVRSGDIACRYGGEELVVIAPGMGLNDAAALSERLRRRMEAMTVPWGEESLGVTLSIGAASWPVARTSTSKELISVADQAMYHAKRTGKNRVSLCDGERFISVQELTPGAAVNARAGNASPIPSDGDASGGDPEETAHGA
jgi:diguanylate cyclase (GGDEF)-like protein